MEKRALFILMPKNFQDFEFNIPYTTLKSKGHSVDVAGLEPGEAKGSKELRHTPNLQLSELTNKDFDLYDALVVPGGPGSTQYLWDNKQIQDAVQYFNSKNKLVAFICYASIIPAQTGILNGKQATVYPTDEAKDIFSHHNVEFVDQGVVTLKDEKIITAQGPNFAQDFANEIVSMLED
jgi:protease I